MGHFFKYLSKNMFSKSLHYFTFFCYHLIRYRHVFKTQKFFTSIYLRKSVFYNMLDLSSP